MANRDPGDVTHLLRRWKEGDSAAEGPLFDALYEHLRRIADGLMSSERPDHTLQATELVHEAFLRIGPESADWDDRVHFFAVAARSMRRVLVDHARARATAKRGQGAARVTLDAELVDGPTGPADLQLLDRALERLEAFDERKARVVEMRYFAGLTNAEIAKATGLSGRTVKRDLQLGRAWIRREIAGGGGPPPPARSGS